MNAILCASADQIVQIVWSRMGRVIISFAFSAQKTTAAGE